MSEEKRKHGRLPLVIETSWEGSGITSPARTTDISATGCFIDTLGQAQVGDTVNLKLTLRDGENIRVEGEVMYQLPRVGFGVRFTNITDSDRLRLESILNTEEQEPVAQDN